MPILTNHKGGQVEADGKALESLKAQGWAEVVTKTASAPAPVEVPKPTRKPRPAKK